MRLSPFLLLGIASFLCWLLPFLLRIFIIEIPEFDVNISNIQNSDNHRTVNSIIKAISKNDNKKAFIMIFTNNIKGCILNIAGGIMLGLGTVINLFINGFYSADVLVTSYKTNMSVSNVLKLTLPHSFELIGFWLSGAIGFYIAWNICVGWSTNTQ